MIEALVSARTQGEVALKKSGDIVCVKLAGSPWGSKEKGAVIQWVDDAVEAELSAMQKAGEPHPVIVYPYAEYEKINVSTAKERVVMVNRSTISVDFDAMSKADVDRLKGRDADVQPLALDAIATKVQPTDTLGGVSQPSRSAPQPKEKG